MNNRIIQYFEQKIEYKIIQLLLLQSDILAKK